MRVCVCVLRDLCEVMSGCSCASRGEPWVKVQLLCISGYFFVVVVLSMMSMRMSIEYPLVMVILTPSYPQVNMLVTELKSEALKDRHWKQLMKRLRVSWQLHDLTLGQVWAVDLQKNEMIVRDVILVAQGEMALEEFLKMVSEQSSWLPW